MHLLLREAEAAFARVIGAASARGAAPPALRSVGARQSLPREEAIFTASFVGHRDAWHWTVPYLDYRTAPLHLRTERPYRALWESQVRAAEARAQESDDAGRRAAEAELRALWGADFLHNLAMVQAELHERLPARAQEALLQARGPDGRRLGDSVGFIVGWYDEARARSCDRAAAATSRGRELTAIAFDELADVPADFWERESRAVQRRVAAAMALPAATVDAGPSNAVTVETIRQAMEQLARAEPPAIDFARAREEAYRAFVSYGVAAFDFRSRAWLEADFGSAEAAAKGEELLRAWLSPAQLAQYDKDKAFEVVGGASGKRYRIRHGRQMNIDELDGKGRKVCGWCFLPQGELVAGDVMLAQKIALESDEAAARKVATLVISAVPPDGAATFGSARDWATYMGGAAPRSARLPPW